MCGITAYIGNKDPVPILLKGLRRLEYRGYDSSGIALLNKEELICIKQSGKVSELQSRIDDSTIKGNCGIAHTRWATHGKPTMVNAHPFVKENCAMVHNGIIENHEELIKIHALNIEDNQFELHFKKRRL